MQVAANIALVKNMTLHGIFWGSYLAQNPKIIRKGLQELVTWLGEEKIFVPVSHRCYIILDLYSCMCLLAGLNVQKAYLCSKSKCKNHAEHKETVHKA